MTIREFLRKYKPEERTEEYEKLRAELEKLRNQFKTARKYFKYFIDPDKVMSNKIEIEMPTLIWKRKRAKQKDL